MYIQIQYEMVECITVAGHLVSVVEQSLAFFLEINVEPVLLTSAGALSSYWYLSKHKLLSAVA